MASSSEEAITARMKDIDARFRAASGLSSRRDYSVFYSRLRPSRVMVIGIKPGGVRDGTHEVASPTFYENDEHEYVDMDYRIAAVMRPALIHAFGMTSAYGLRRVPKTNCFFSRAVGTDDFSASELRANAALCAPFLAEMIAAVDPDVLIMEGGGARDLLVRHQCRDVREGLPQRVQCLRRGSLNTFFKREKAFLIPLGREVTILTLGHPSQFGHLPTWPRAVDALRSNLGPRFLSESGGPEDDSESAVPDDDRSDPVDPTSVEPVGRPPDPRRPPASAGPRTNDGRTFTAGSRPPITFGYRPIHDFWQELTKTGAVSVDAFYDHLIAVGWLRPSGKSLTPQIVRTDLVSMVRHGFAVARGSR